MPTDTSFASELSVMRVEWWTHLEMHVLAEFPSAVEAVECADEIQRELGKRNAQLAEHRRMLFRIGINLR